MRVIHSRGDDNVCRGTAHRPAVGPWIPHRRSRKQGGEKRRPLRCRGTRAAPGMGSRGLIEIVGAQGYRRKYFLRYTAFVTLWSGHRSVGGGSSASSGLVNLDPGAGSGRRSRGSNLVSSLSLVPP